MKICYILLAHDNPDGVLDKVNLLGSEDYIVIHWDKSNRFNIKEYISTRAKICTLNNIFFSDRIDVKWGKWSMIQATLAAIKKALHLTDVDYFYLISNSDIPIKSNIDLKKFLRKNYGKSFIECIHPSEGKWCPQQRAEDRYEIYHFISWRQSKFWYMLLYRIQKLLKIKRIPPYNMGVYFGSQWFCIHNVLMRKIYELSQDKKIKKFFSKTSIPDEHFMQSLAMHLDEHSIVKETLTWYKFDSYGFPIEIYNDNIDEINKTEGKFFARKISNEFREKLIPSDKSSKIKGYSFYEHCDNYFRNLNQIENKYYVIYYYYYYYYYYYIAKNYKMVNGYSLPESLFNKQQIKYGDTKPNPNYRYSDIKLRDSNITLFISDILRFNPKTVLSIDVVDSPDLADKLLFHSKSIPILFFSEDCNLIFGNSGEISVHSKSNDIKATIASLKMIPILKKCINYKDEFHIIRNHNDLSTILSNN